MMSDLIERDKIYEAVYDLACKSVSVIGGISEDYAYGLLEAAHMIEEAPAVDAVPMTHAKWLLRHVGHGHYWECSHCHQNPCIYVTEDTKFCPNCGAKMNGEGDAE